MLCIKKLEKNVRISDFHKNIILLDNFGRLHYNKPYSKGNCVHKLVKELNKNIHFKKKALPSSIWHNGDAKIYKESQRYQTALLLALNFFASSPP